jgi:CRISPR-associated protein Csx17
VDAGITEFRRFALFHTTSENTFESCLAVVVPAMKSADSALAVALDVALDLRDSLPRDWKKGKRWIYAGLRGPLDRALIELSACPGPAAKRSLVDALVVALRAVDRNRSHRKHNVRFRLLPAAWTDSLIGEHDEITPEIRLAYAIASIRPSHTIPGRNSETAAPILAYWLGAENQGNWWAIPERVPLRRVWGAGEFAANIGAILRRRLVEERPDAEPPFDGRLHVGLADIEALLLRQLDEAELTRWFFRFSLFACQGARSFAWDQRLRSGGWLEVISPSAALFALFKPMFDGRLIRHQSIGASRTMKAGTLSRIVAFLMRSDISSAVAAARNAYHAVGVELGDFEYHFEAQNPSHLLASLMVPVRNNEVAQVFGRWRLPEKS